MSQVLRGSGMGFGSVLPFHVIYYDSNILGDTPEDRKHCTAAKHAVQARTQTVLPWPVWLALYLSYINGYISACLHAITRSGDAGGFCAPNLYMGRWATMPLVLPKGHPSVIGGIQDSKQVFALQLRFPVSFGLLHLQLDLRTGLLTLHQPSDEEE